MDRATMQCLRKTTRVLGTLRAVAFSVVMLACVQAIGAMQETRAGAGSLVALTAETVGFDARVEQTYPGITHVAQYRTMRPFLVLLVNQNASTVEAYAVRWRVATPGGDPQELTTSFIRRHFLTPDVDQAIASNAVRLVYPLFNLSPAEYVAERDFAQRYPASVYPQGSSSPAVQGSLDGVVYADGSFSGADTTRIWELYKCSQNGERDEAIAVLEMDGAHASGDEMRRRLDRDVMRGIYVQGQDLQAMYQHARGESADRMRVQLRLVGQAAFVEELQQVVDRSSSENYSSMATWF